MGATKGETAAGGNQKPLVPFDSFREGGENVADCFQNSLEGGETMNKGELARLITFLENVNWTPEMILDLLKYVGK